ncbi:hypothetical protein DM01DRAFT_1086258 [Hesseltinella vesiculosa]|uniref:Peroxin domain-containing protein n=1 Tax=Hesseltinella vesiculosa TaxID=101127 RepID=A0A1X2GD89_9FUNG|nr:hypothetical protein DM01DRAFT_1086258 [Hesseltinella vesiculosa]
MLNDIHLFPFRAGPLAQGVAWYLCCRNFSFLVTYLLPLLPLAYYCYTPKKSQHIAHLDWLRDMTMQVLKQARNWYISHYPPHLFLIGLYGYIVWVTLHQWLSTRWVATLIGWLVLAKDHWAEKMAMTPNVVSLIAFLLPPMTSSRERLMQRALDFQHQYMLLTLDSGHHQQTSKPFSFTVYENQRQWPFNGSTWHAFTLPFERNPWSDEHQFSVLPLQQLVLPASVQVQDKEQGLKRVWSWVWVDSDWGNEPWVDSDFTWTKADTPTSFFATRQRKWTRHAVLQYDCIVQQALTTSHVKPVIPLAPLAITSPTSIPPATVYPASTSPVTTKQTSTSLASPSSPRPSLSSDFAGYLPAEASQSQTSLLSTKTTSSTLHDKPRRSLSRSSTRRQAVWKSITPKQS